MAILKKGTNTKLGKSIASFNLPAVSTCPGRTKLCEGICYATSGFYRFGNVQRSLLASLAESKRPDFASAVSAELSRKRGPKAVRIHASGDFYSAAYISSWIAIARAAPDTSFWAYTRSWRLPSLRPKLKELSQLPNVQLWASVDEETQARSSSNAGSMVKETPPSWLRIADVVDSWDQVDSSFVQCPNLKNKSITCEQCTYCFKPNKTRKKNVAFIKH